MIGKISGRVVEKNSRSAIVEAGGIGYRVFAQEKTLEACALGADVSLWTHLWVKEDALDLYGFLSEEELSFFELLIGISGIGPKTALGILSIAPPETLAQAIASGNTSYLTKVSGIGRKNAEKIVLELRDKLKSAAREEDGSNALSEDADVLLALKSLGYGAKEAREAMQQISNDVKDTGERIKAALKHLHK